METITSWSACDTFCSRLKVAQRSPELVWAFVKPYYQRVDAYPLRFAIVMTLNYYLNDEYIDEVLALLDAVHHEDYYVRMAVAWALSMAYLSHPEKTMRLLENSTQDDWTYNKTLRKIIESRHVDDAARQQLREMRRKAVEPYA